MKYLCVCVCFIKMGDLIYINIFFTVMYAYNTRRDINGYLTVYCIAYLLHVIPTYIVIHIIIQYIYYKVYTRITEKHIYMKCLRIRSIIDTKRT